MNRLAREASAYLNAHADNPVDWWPWSEAALELAQRQDRPILLSIGYSACHWCHVMAQESFEAPACAELLNRHFVCIKVDREEHPELDQLYQQAHLLLTRKPGGWPLNLFLTPAGVPFYGGSYYPDEERFGLPAFNSVLKKVAAAWLRQRDAIDQHSPRLVEALQLSLIGAFPDACGTLDRSGVRACLRHLLKHFDPRYGGFGGHAKFPHPVSLELLLHAGVLRNDDEARHAALHSLRKMAEGGLYDQLGGGFFRYCNEANWTRPHFEKLLGDNALLLWLYSEAFALTGETLFQRTALATASWLLRELRTPEGGFCSALDADTDGLAGKHYLWQRDEITALLDGERLALVKAHFGLDAPPGEEFNTWHLRVVRPLEEVAGTLAIPPHTARQQLDAACARLLASRESRSRPQRDEKLLTAANAFAIRALTRSASVFNKPDLLEAAQRALICVHARCERNGRLLTCSSAGQDGPPGVLDDYAALLSACLELLQAQFRQSDLDFACQLADALLQHFTAPTGGFHTTADDAPALIARARPIHDNAAPAGDPLAARALLRLGHLIGEARYLNAAERCLRTFHASLETHASVPGLALLLEEWLAPPVIVVLRGDPVEAQQWQTSLRSQCHPDLICLYVPPGLNGLPPSLDKPAGSSSTAWVCRGPRCLPPAGTLRELQEAIAPEPDYLPESWQHHTP